MGVEGDGSSSDWELRADSVSPGAVSPSAPEVRSGGVGVVQAVMELPEEVSRSMKYEMLKVKGMRRAKKMGRMMAGFKYFGHSAFANAFLSTWSLPGSRCDTICFMPAWPLFFLRRLKLFRISKNNDLSSS